MNNDVLLATAAAKANAHNGLADALETGHVSMIRLNGVFRLTARGDAGTFLVTFDGLGHAHCNGYRLGGSAAPLALDALRDARDNGPHVRG